MIKTPESHHKTQQQKTRETREEQNPPATNYYTSHVMAHMNNFASTTEENYHSHFLNNNNHHILNNMAITKNNNTTRSNNNNNKRRRSFTDSCDFSPISKIQKSSLYDDYDCCIHPMHEYETSKFAAQLSLDSDWFNEDQCMIEAPLEFSPVNFDEGLSELPSIFDEDSYIDPFKDHDKLLQQESEEEEEDNVFPAVEPEIVFSKNYNPIISGSQPGSANSFEKMTCTTKKEPSFGNLVTVPLSSEYEESDESLMSSSVDNNGQSGISRSSVSCAPSVISEPSHRYQVKNEPADDSDYEAVNDDDDEEEEENVYTFTPSQSSQNRDIEQIKLSFMSTESMPAPVKKELTPSERNVIITDELSLLVGTKHHISFMILSPERNRHRTYDIPRKDIMSRKGDKDTTLKIGSGSEKKFKYFLHVLFKTKQTRVPKLELVKEDEDVGINKSLKIHQSQLVGNGMIARYSLSFLVNSFEHERKSFHLVCRDQNGTALTRSVPFKLNARKTSDCLFHLKSSTPSKKKKNVRADEDSD